MKFFLILLVMFTVFISSFSYAQENECYAQEAKTYLIGMLDDIFKQEIKTQYDARQFGGEKYCADSTVYNETTQQHLPCWAFSFLLSSLVEKMTPSSNTLLFIDAAKSEASILVTCSVMEQNGKSHEIEFVLKPKRGSKLSANNLAVSRFKMLGVRAGR